MARDDAPPFARGETYANGNMEILNAATEFWGLGGINLEGKEFVFEPNSQDDTGLSYSALGPDPNGRPIRVKVVRNVSGQNLKPKRLARYQLATTGHQPGDPGGRLHRASVADVPAGMIDEFLPPAGVPTNDLFYLVIEGPTTGTTLSTGTVAINQGDRLVPGTGTSKTDDTAGRVASQVLTGATATLGENILNCVGRSDSVTEVTTTSASIPIVLHLFGG